jgi:hypothetical protein
MKHILKFSLIFFTFFSSNYLSAQVQGKFGINQNSLNVNAVLEIESASKGVLLPRLTTAQQNAMSAPSDGMVIYNTDSTCFVLRRAGAWRSLCLANGGDAWTTLGNGGTNAATHFLGTTDAQNLVIKANSITRITARATDNFGVLLDNYPLSSGGHGAVVSTLNFRSNNFQAQNNARVHFNSLVLGTMGSTGTQHVSFNQADVQVAGAFATLRGVSTSLLINNAATLTDYSHFFAGGTISNSTITDYYGLRINPTISGGTMTNAYGVDLTTPPFATNYTGVRVGAITAAANRYAFLYNAAANPVAISASGNLGINTTAPQYKLDIDAQTGNAGNPARLLGLNAGATSDSIISSNAGVLRRLSIAEVTANDWNILGNINTSDATNFVGTTNAQALVFKTNNTEGMRLTTGQTLGIGTTTPLSTSRLHVENTGTNHAFYAPIGTNYNYFAGKTAFGRATNNPTTTLIGAAADPLVAIQDTITTLSSSIVTEGLAVKLKVVPMAASTGGVYGMNARVHTAAYNGQNIGVLEAANFDNRHYGTGTLSNSYGVIARSVNLGTGRVNKSYGMLVDVGNYVGTTDSLWGIQISSGGFGTLTNATFGVGLQIGDVAATTAYGIWQGGGDDKNYLAGHTGMALTAKVGNNPLTIDANSLLELESTTKTFVPPRMTTAQMTALTGALVGSVIYNTTLDCLHQKTASGWLSMCNSANPFVQEATQTTFLTQNFTSSFTDIPGISPITINVPRTTTYTITVKAYMASNAPTSSSSNSGIQGSFKLIIDGLSYEESYMSSVGIYNAAGNFNLYGLGGQNTAFKVITLSAGTHTVGVQGRMWAGTNCTSGTWGIPTSTYVNSLSAEAGKCKLIVVEN